MKILLISLFVMIIATASIHAETVTVITKQGAIRESCRYFSPVKVTAHHNDVLEVISKEGEWYKVEFKGIQGCINKSEVEKKSISFSNIAGSEKQSTSNEEVALAGKGFNPQIEEAYKKENPNLNFGAVNKIENYKVSESKLIKFIQSGKLNSQ
jgi:replication initiation and membrane attachment protein DnaB